MGMLTEDINSSFSLGLLSKSTALEVCSVFSFAELGFFQPGEGKAWWDIKLLSSPVLWQDFRMPRMQFSGYQSCLHLQILHSCV